MTRIGLSLKALFLLIAAGLIFSLLLMVAARAEAPTPTLPAAYTCETGPFARLAKLFGGECRMEFFDVEGSEVEFSEAPVAATPAAPAQSVTEENGEKHGKYKKNKRRHYNHRRHGRRGGRN